MTTWDPLSAELNDEDIIAEAKKRQIKNILKSYVGLFDPFSELIQNSMDAVDLRATTLQEKDYQKKIWIVVNLQDETFTITDNGVGFNEAQFKSFLAPNISFKDATKTRGHKGVGSTYIAYGFNYLQLGTKTPGYTFVAEIAEGRNWIEDTERIVTRPQVSESKSLSVAFDAVDRGSTFTIKFGGNKTRPKSLLSFGAEDALQWLYILLIKTPLGQIDFFDESSGKTKFDLIVIDKNGTSSEVKDHECCYIYPHTKITASANLKEMLEAQKKMATSGKPAQGLPQKFTRLNGIYEFYKTDELQVFVGKTKNKDSIQEKKQLLTDYQITAYGYFCYSTDVWDELNDNVLKLRKGMRVLRGGLQLANNYMPQGELIVIPLTSNIGYQNQSHIIVHFKNADPDLGRKGFQPELKELAEELAVRIVTRLKEWREYLKVDTGQQPNIAASDEVFDWLQNQLEYEKKHPLVISNPNFFEPLKEISITSLPQSEQDVIVLFNQLVAGGVIRGIRLLATDQKKQYDGVYRFYVKKPFDNHTYDKVKNPLGVVKLEHKDDYSSRPYILEYKQNVDALLREFENDEKDQAEIKMIIAWDMGDLWKKRYTVTSLLDLSNLHHREFHGLTHLFHSGTNNKTYGIILSELIAYLNDVDAVQDYHKKTYSDDIDD